MVLVLAESLAKEDNTGNCWHGSTPRRLIDRIKQVSVLGTSVMLAVIYLFLLT